MTSDREIEEQIAKELEDMKTEEVSNLKAIKAEICRIPLQIKEEELKIFGLQKALETIAVEKKRIETTTFDKVCNETITIEGKDGEKTEKKSFTNEKAREAETWQRLQKDSEYVEYLDKERNTAKLLVQSKAQFDFLKRQLKVKEMLIEIIKLERD
jgi:hypothetical protein